MNGTPSDTSSASPRRSSHSPKTGGSPSRLQLGRPPLAPAHDCDLGSPKRVPQNQNAQLVLSLGPHYEGHHGKFELESGAASPFTQACTKLDLAGSPKRVKPQENPTSPATLRNFWCSHNAWSAEVLCKSNDIEGRLAASVRSEEPRRPSFGGAARTFPLREEDTAFSRDGSGGEATADEDGGQHGQTDDGKKTTVMLQNVPLDYTRTMLLNLLDKEGFKARYNFLYLPHDFSRQTSLGYAFINLLSPEDAAQFRLRFEGFTNWGVESEKVAGVAWSFAHQGPTGHVERYRNSPVMHPIVADRCKPVLLRDGVPIPFPPPTRPVRPPRIRPPKNRA